MRSAHGLWVETVNSKWTWRALAVGVSCLAVWAYMSGLHLSLWHDEAVTIDQFIKLGPSSILFGDFTFNNHVLFSLLAWMATEVAGPSEISYRIWAVVPSLGAVALVAWWLHREFDRFAALLFGVLAIASPPFFQLAREARGYGLAFLATALLLVSSHLMLKANRQLGVLGAVAAGVVGMSALATFSIPFVISMVVVAALTHRWGRAAMVTLVAGSIASIVYVSRLSEVIGGARRKFGAPLQWFEPVTAWVFHHIEPLGYLVFSQSPNVDAQGTTRPMGPLESNEIFFAIAGFFVAFGALMSIIKFGRSAHRGAVALIIAPIFGTYVVLAVSRLYIAGRFVSFLTINCLALVAAAGSLLLARLRISRPAFSRTIITMIGVIVVALIIGFVSWAKTWHVTPMENFKDVAALAADTGFDIVHTDSVRPQGLKYYLEDQLLIKVNPEALCSLNQFVFIHHPYRNDRELPRCLSEAGVRVTRYSQQSRGLFLSVFVRDEPSSHSLDD